MWRAGASYDLTGNGRTALKASYSRYGLQVGIDRVTARQPAVELVAGLLRGPTRTATASSRRPRLGTCPGFAGISTFYPDADGPDWPYSDEVTAGVEQQVMRDMRVGVMYYYRTNRDQLGVRNLAVPPSAYTPFTCDDPGRPERRRRPLTVYNLAPAFNGLQNNIRDNEPYLDTEYNGIEFTANKRFSRNWQMVAGLTIGKNKGGLNSGGTNPGQTDSATLAGFSGGDLNDPNNTRFCERHHRQRLRGRLPPVGQLSAAVVDLTLPGSLVSNSGYPFVSTYSAEPRGGGARGDPDARQPDGVPQRAR